MPTNKELIIKSLYECLKIVSNSQIVVLDLKKLALKEPVIANSDELL
jgi:hypothetical protein